MFGMGIREEERRITYSKRNETLWLDGLTLPNVANLRMNITGIRHSRHMIEEEFDNYEPESEEFDCICEIHTRLVELSLRLTS